MLRNGRPAALALTRQPLPTIDRKHHASTRGVAKGAYVLIDGGPGGKETPEVILVATGSEVAIALEARDRLEKAGTRTRVVSMPCREWFEDQTRAYQDKVLPPSIRARVSIEAAVSLGWHDIVGDAGRCISLEHFGASADYKTLYKEFGLTPEAAVKAARDSIRAAGATAGHGAAARVTETRPRAAGSLDRTRDTMTTDTTTRKSAATKSAASKGK